MYKLKNLHVHHHIVQLVGHLVILHVQHHVGRHAGHLVNLHVHHNVSLSDTSEATPVHLCVVRFKGTHNR